MPAGDYPTRFEWLKRTPGDPDGFGQRADGHPSQGYLWGVVEDLAGGRASAQESERAEITATVRLRNLPAVVAGDRLSAGGAVWTVESAVEGDNELILDVRRPRWTAGGGKAE